jgi:hypothetical protein
LSSGERSVEGVGKWGGAQTIEILFVASLDKIAILVGKKILLTVNL